MAVPEGIYLNAFDVLSVHVQKIVVEFQG